MDINHTRKTTIAAAAIRAFLDHTDAFVFVKDCSRTDRILPLCTRRRTKRCTVQSAAEKTAAALQVKKIL